jgi:hypothetical protein
MAKPFYLSLQQHLVRWTLLLMFVRAGTAVQAQTLSVVHGQVEAITDAQRQQFNIMQAEWRPATSSLPAHAYVLGCHDCAGAKYDSQGNLITVGLKKIPTTYILRVPENYNERLVIMVPPGNLSHTTLLRMKIPLTEGYAFAVMNHPSPGFPSFPYDQFIEPPYHADDLRHKYFATGHLLKELVSGVFGTPRGTYGLGVSRGVLEAMGILAAEQGVPFDGYVIESGGNGRLTRLMSFIQSMRTDQLVPLTGLQNPLATRTQSQVQEFFAAEMSAADPEYRGWILGSQASALDYDVAQRPWEVQLAWKSLEYGGDIQRPTIIITGLSDRTIFPGDTLQYAEKIVASGKHDLMRLYLFKFMGHGGTFDPQGPSAAPESLSAYAISELDGWVQNGTEPGILSAGSLLGSSQSCAILGYIDDPMGCFHEIFGRGP